MKIKRENIGDCPRGDDWLVERLRFSGGVWHNYVEESRTACGKKALASF